MQHGQIFELKTDGQRLWAYRHRLDGRGSRRIQRGGCVTADDAREAPAGADRDATPQASRPRDAR